jgi:long-chain acyl-CoA synthetase
MRQSIKQVIINAYEQHGDRPFVWTRNNGEYQPRTYGELIGRSFALATFLIKRKIENKKVVIFAKNSWQWIAADYALALSSNVAVLMDASWKLLGAKNASLFIEPAVIMYDAQTEPIVKKLKRELPKETIYFSLERDMPDLLDHVPENLPERKPDDLAKIFFSSGTTGTPKAIMLSEKNMLFGWDEIDRRMKNIGPDDTCYVFLPFHHVYGNVIILLYILFIGAQIYLCSDIKKAREELLLARPAIIHGVPLFYERIYAAIPEKDVAKAKKAVKLANTFHLPRGMRKKLFAPLHKALGGRIKYMISGGSVLDPALHKFFDDAGLYIYLTYASTETSSTLFASEDGSKNHASVGRAFHGVVVKLFKPDETGVGEIIVKGDNVFLGYYNNPEANAKAYDANGFFHTGDLGRFDKDDQLYIIGRKKRMILLSNAENVFPDEIEALIEQSPAIKKAFVFDDNNVIKAELLIQNETDSRKAREYVEQVNKELPKYAKVREVSLRLADESVRIKK